MISLHEWGHWFIAYLLNYKYGYVIFSLAGGLFFLNEPLRGIADGFLIGVGGGFTVCFIFSMLYLCLDWETDFIEKNVLRNYALHQIFYGYFEGLYGLGLIGIDILQLVSNIVYPVILYSTLIYIFIKIGVDDC